MYSYDEVTKLLEIQRKSIMEFEAAKYKLMMGGEQKPAEAVREQALIAARRANIPPRYKGPPRYFNPAPSWRQWNEMTGEERRLYKAACTSKTDLVRAGQRGPRVMDIYNEMREKQIDK